ncbi:MAG: hypothetical protein JWM37_479 [Candidatus Saccharibacteria bacterium]|nr:hypothetical protein [Candidatus Saccharibacteria bacterium]
MAGKQGFASMDADKQRSIAAKGGMASHGGSFKDKDFASQQGKKGGAKSRRNT